MVQKLVNFGVVLETFFDVSRHSDRFFHQDFFKVVVNHLIRTLVKFLTEFTRGVSSNICGEKNTFFFSIFDPTTVGSAVVGQPKSEIVHFGLSRYSRDSLWIFMKIWKFQERTWIYSMTWMVRKPSEIDLVHHNDIIETFTVQILHILLHDKMRLVV